MDNNLLNGSGQYFPLVGISDIIAYAKNGDDR